MPGENCAILGCGSCRRTKGIGIWKLPAPKDEAHKKWRDEWLQYITRSRDLDRLFKELLVKDREFKCENVSRQKTSKYVSKSKQIRTYSMRKHVICTCLYSPFYYYDFILVPLYCSCYVRNIGMNVKWLIILLFTPRSWRKRDRDSAQFRK